ncbi:SMC-Scp complex subunit ScpB [Candidatus Woesearchaeota archaeon]|nr:MAG: segregation and condensation protein B [archaeon GW2011_AR4]MBS3130375.1 SMC-Scp complex subunit ScpB [Candidatus Woesearchaeota archaeon]HIH38240.1 SMC-Scp complex subunit ScpB [Candidatus Woesearchaeota archaeon]HIH49087.1 SMC-Scp complex subunit ScpB [Candidatus Woesearchaeota archaeon]HIJ04174.1 SMC-Scp complex subunit ScpB [Candidatus Woesearchaeota archaeon]
MRLHKELEALLFSSGRKMTVEELAKLTRDNEEDIALALHEIKKRLDDEQSSLMLIEEEPGSWKLSVQEKFVPLVSNVVTKTDLPKTVIETLAVVAWKAPVLQSDVIAIRTNKAYDHLAELEEQGYISRVKKGRTKLIRLAPKFFDYFDLPPDKLKEHFGKFDNIEQLITSKEDEARRLSAELKKLKETEAEEKRKQQQLMDGTIDLEPIDLDAKETENSIPRAHEPEKPPSHTNQTEKTTTGGNGQDVS